MSGDANGEMDEEVSADVDGSDEKDVSPLEAPDSNGLIDALVGNGFFFRVGQPIEVVLDGGENGSISEVARKNGYTIQDVVPASGAVSTRVLLAPKQLVREKADEVERVHRGAMESVNVEDIERMDG